jgi:hypothetical protein
VLPLNCAKAVKTRQNSVDTALKREFYALIPDYFVDDGSRQQPATANVALSMHAAQAGSVLIIDECNMLKIHRNLLSGWLARARQQFQVLTYPLAKRPQTLTVTRFPSNDCALIITHAYKAS